MMKIPLARQRLMLADLLAPSPSSPWTIRQYKNDLTPSSSSVTGDFTEADYPGYSALGMGTWTVDSGVDGDGNVFATAPDREFTLAGDLSPEQLVYGYFITDTSGVLVWAERFAITLHYSIDGDRCTVHPVIRMHQME